VGLLHQRSVLVVQLEVQQHAAVPALVRAGHVLQEDPEAVRRRPEVQPGRQAAVAVGTAGGGVARARPARAALVAVRREQPAAPQDVGGVQRRPPLAAHQRDGGALGAGVVQVGGRDPQSGVRCVALT